MLLSVVWDVVLLIVAIVSAVWLSSVVWRMFSERDLGPIVKDPQRRRLRRPREDWLAAVLLLLASGLLSLAAFNQTAALLSLYRGHP